ncbi:MAG: D-glycero-alpha-D-manno-heptose-1,7-bisphosphate 7-phosphatase [Planctomycetota bacterium]|jgi:histidinol-phosphate phosphatase family protein
MSDAGIFLDRDGTIIEEIGGYIRSPDQVALLPNAGEGVRAMKALGVPVFVATNQAGVAKKIITERDVEAANLRMIALLAVQGASVDGIYFCPHHPDGEEPLYAVECPCRKPKPGLLERAAGEHRVDLEKSFMVGDSARDLGAGRAVGAKTVLVLTGKGRETLGDAPAHPDADHVAPDLAAAAEWIAARLTA